MSDDQKPAQTALTVDGLVAAFHGRFEPAPISPLYRVGLFLVAVAMILLPVFYVALIGLAASGILWHLQHDTWLLNIEGNGFIRAGLYLAPVVAGGILGNLDRLHDQTLVCEAGRLARSCLTRSRGSAPAFCPD